MLNNTEDDVRRIGVRLIDDAYLAWFSAEVECGNTLRAWFQSTGERRETAYLAYLAALDREEASARDLERLWEVASACSVALAEEAERIAQ